MGEQGVAEEVIEVLLGDHRRIRSTLEEFESLGDRDHVQRSKVVARMIELVTVHGYVDRAVLYPRLVGPDEGSELDAICADQQVTQSIAAELWTMRPDTDGFMLLVLALIDRVRAHLGFEQVCWFPRVATALDDAQCRELAADLVGYRRRAPTSPRADR